MTEEQENVLGMSDEDFLKMPAPVAANEGEPGSPSDAAETEVTPELQPVAVEENGEPDEEPTPELDPVDPAAETAPLEAGQQPVQKGGEASPTPEATEPKAEKQETDYKGFFEKVMTTFQANGKKIELRSPEEAIQLMQMGANYTAKMQQIAPHRKMLLMLENNGLLDEGKLSFLIDIEKKNPEAIRKLVKDAGIDPLDIDTTSDSAYQEGNHRVTDDEANFRSVLDEVGSSDTGKEVLKHINTTWDQASKELLWKQPEVMAIMHQQKESGIYDRIATEIDRQRTLGVIPTTMPFVQAYRTVGDQLMANNAFADLAQTPATSTPPLAPVATRVAAPKPVVDNGKKASAAASPRGTQQKAKVLINPLAMSDEEFLKQMENRV